MHGHYDTDEEGEPEGIRITHGYSRERRPDLKQFVVDLMSAGDGGIPLFLRVADGNETDAAVFGELIKDFRGRLEFDALFVADAALYGAENLASLGNLRWLCRVPRTLSEARRVLAETPREAFVQSEAHEGYRIAQRRSDYGGVGQRWLVVHSEELEKAARQRLERRLQRRERELEREYSRLVGAKTFACQADALAAAQAFAAKNLGQHHRLGSAPRVVEVASYGNKRGRPARGVEPEEVRYRVEAPIERDREAIDQELERAGRYLLATNDGVVEVMDSEGEQGLSAEELLTEYKDQSHVERGFKFLKDPLLRSSIFRLQPVREESQAGGGHSDGYGAVSAGLCFGGALLARSSGESRGVDSAPDGKADSEANAEVGVPAIPGHTPAQGGRSGADLQPHRGAKNHPGFPWARLPTILSTHLKGCGT